MYYLMKVRCELSLNASPCIPNVCYSTKCNKKYYHVLHARPR